MSHFLNQIVEKRIQERENRISNIEQGTANVEVFWVSSLDWSSCPVTLNDWSMPRGGTVSQRGLPSLASMIGAIGSARCSVARRPFKRALGSER